MTISGLIQVVKSVLSAMIGVQTEANRKKDFSVSSPKAHIITGIIFTLLLVLGLSLVVSFIV